MNKKDEKFGELELKDGRTLTLQQHPYLASYYNDSWYQALAVDPSGNEYYVRWGTINPDAEDESNSCDWDKFTIKRI